MYNRINQGNMKIAKQITDLIGHTPLVELSKYSKLHGAETPIIAKVEYFNPGGSIKDRVAFSMIEDAERKGILKPGATIIEPTSGNTGVGEALVAAVKGYKLILTMPETMSVERRNLVKAYGAEVKLTSGAEGMPGAIKAAEELRASIPGAVILGQFVNPANPQIHYQTTGPEIWEDTDGTVDIVVGGVGTGGTLTGVGEYLKSQNPDVKIVALEPASSPVLSTGKGGPHKIQGIGAGFVPDVLNTTVYDEIFTVENDDAFATGKLLAKKEGISAPYAFRMFLLSTLIVSGIVRMIRYPLTAAIDARPIPVFPEVGSMITEPSFNNPFSSASSIIALAILSFTLPAGLKYSSFTRILASNPNSSSIFFTSTRGVFPTSSKAPL